MKRLYLGFFAIVILATPVFMQAPADAEAKKRQIITEWVNSQVSKRNDPALEKDIRKWWQGPDPANKPDPILRIIFLQPAYTIERNPYGEVLRKYVDTLILWSSKDRSNCHIQWRSFGYDSLGAGTFSDEMQAFIKREYVEWSHGKSIWLTGGVGVRAGAHYEVKCGSFVK